MSRRHVPAARRAVPVGAPARRPRARSCPAVEEMLRWVTPIKNMARTVTRDVEFHGQDPRGGPEAAAALPVGQPRRERFADPDTFDLDRTPERPRRVRLRLALLPRAARSPASSCGRCSRCCSTGCPTCGSPPGPEPAHRGRQLRERLRVDAGHVLRHGAPPAPRSPEPDARRGAAASVVVADGDHPGAVDDRHPRRGVDDDPERLGRLGHARRATSGIETVDHARGRARS